MRRLWLRASGSNPCAAVGPSLDLGRAVRARLVAPPCAHLEHSPNRRPHADHHEGQRLRDAAPRLLSLGEEVVVQKGARRRGGEADGPNHVPAGAVRPPPRPPVGRLLCGTDCAARALQGVAKEGMVREGLLSLVGWGVSAHDRVGARISMP